jgi:hypothetical protein
VLFEILITTGENSNDIYPTRTYHISLSTFHLQKTIGSPDNYTLLARQPRLAEFESCFAEKYEEKLYPLWLQRIIDVLPHRTEWHARRRAIKRIQEIEKDMRWGIGENISTFLNQAD